MPFDRVTQVGTAFVACMYDVDVRGVHGDDAARRLLRETRERVRAGRAVRPEAAHYVNVIASGSVDDAVRRVLLSELGNQDGVDSVAVSGAAPVDAGAPEVDRLASAVDADRPTHAAPPGGGWEKVAQAAQADAVLVAEVTAVADGEIRVSLEGVVGSLREDAGRAPPALGERLRVRVVMLNLKRRVLEVMRARE